MQIDASQRVLSRVGDPATAIVIRVAALNSLVGNVHDAHASAESRAVVLAQRLDELGAAHPTVASLRDEADTIGTLLEGASVLRDAPDAHRLVDAPVDPEAQASLVLDGGAMMHTFLREMEACRALDERGVCGAGELTSAVALEPRVSALERTQEARARETSDAHRRIVQLLARYGDYVRSGRAPYYGADRQVDRVSKIFVGLDATLGELEARVRHEEKRRQPVCR